MEYRIMRGNSARAGGEKEVEDIMLSPSHDLYGVLNESGWKRILSDTSLRFNEIKAYMENVVYVSPSLYCLSFPSYQNQIPFFDDYEIIDVWVRMIRKQASLPKWTYLSALWSGYADIIRWKAWPLSL